jgi:hypothetical protein
MLNKFIILKGNILFRNIGNAFLLILILGTTVFLFSYAIYAEPRDYFNVIVVWMMTRYGSLFAGVLFLVFRFFKIIRTNYKFIYVFVGILNICEGFLSLVLFFFHGVNVWWFRECLLNSLVGVIIIGDAFLISVDNN